MNSIARVYSVVLGAVLLVVGLLGWMPILTPDGKLFGIFAINSLHNLAHVLTGMIGVGAGLTLSDRSVRAYTITMSAIYGVLVLVGVAQVGVLEHALAINLADTILHAGIFIFSLFVCVVSFTEFNSLRRLQRLTALRIQSPASVHSAALRSSGDPYAELVPQSRWARLPSQPLSPPLAPTLSADRRFAPPAADDSLESMQERLIWLEREVRTMRGALERQDALEQQQQQLRRELEMLRTQLAGQAVGQGMRPTGSPAQPGGVQGSRSPSSRLSYPTSGASELGAWAAPSNLAMPPGEFAPAAGYPTPAPYTPYGAYARPSGPSGPTRSQASLYPQYPSLETAGQPTPLPRYGPGAADPQTPNANGARQPDRQAETQRQSGAPNVPQQGSPGRASEQDQQDQEAGASSSWRTQPW